MLSICIPVFNRDVRPLVQTLLRQIQSNDYPCEVVLLDDGSDEKYQILNRELRSTVCYAEMDHNLGRSAIRNRFLQYASGSHLLFLDCDAEVSDDQFISRYLAEVQNGRLVVCGGHRYVGHVDDSHRLKYRYGCCCEVRSAAQRLRDPNRSFMTGNFMIAKYILAENPFDERLSRYGHEDTLMGYQLSQKHYQVWHIDNPIDLRDIDTNEQFLRKTGEGILNLVAIYRWVDHPDDFAAQVRLLSCYKYLKMRHLSGVVRFVFIVFKNGLERRLQSGKGSLKAFNFYKIGLLCQALG